MSSDSPVPITVRVNGTLHHLRVPVDVTLVDMLRDELQLFSCRETCGIGVCGTCTVLVDGEVTSACLRFAFTVDEAEVITAEGLASGSDLHPVQSAFIEEQAFQCSFCTPGFVVSVADLHQQRQDGRLADEDLDDAIDAHLGGHLCRCGSYRQIVAATRRALR